MKLLNILLFTFACLITNPNNVIAQMQYIENKGQFPEQVLFEAALPGGKVFLENNQWTFNFQEQQAHHHGASHTHKTEKEVLKGHAYQMMFEGANANIECQTFYPAETYNNYFIGNDKSKWASNVKLFKQIVYKNMYPKTDVKVYSNSSGMKYDFILKAGANPDLINIKYEGLHDLYKDKKGNLFLKTSINDIKESKPYAYQIINGVTTEVSCEFIIRDCTVSFHFPNGYDKTNQLIIDPELIFSSYSGSTVDNWGFCSTYDEEGHLYGAGVVFDEGYPVTIGAYQTTFATGDCDIGITKFSPDGSQLVYSTYLGGDDSELPHSMMVNNQNQLVLFGTTGSENFPIMMGYDDSFNGGNFTSLAISYLEFQNGSDIFLTIFDASGNELIGSTYFGGSDNDGLNDTGINDLTYNWNDRVRGEVIIDDFDNVYIGTCTYSKDIPGSLSSPNNKLEGLIAKFSPDLSQLEWASFVGGNEEDAIYSIELDAEQNVYACGGTQGMDLSAFTSINSNYQGGQSDGFIVKLNPDGSTNTASFLGTSDYDQCFFIDLDVEGNVYAMGQTEGTYPIEGENIFSQANTKQFIHKLSNDLTSSIWSTTFGNGDKVNISPTAFKVDSLERILIAGWGGSANIIWNNQSGSTNGLMTTPNACQTTTDGSDFYFMVFEQDAIGIQYASFFGGSGNIGGSEHTDGGSSRFDDNGILYQAVCADCGGVDNFPTTFGAWSNENVSVNCNLGVIKFDFSLEGNNCNLLGIEEITQSKHTLFPNPFSERFNIQFNHPLSTNATAYIYDIAGQLILEQSLKQGQEQAIFKMGQYPAGSYFVKVVSSEIDLLVTQKVVKY